MSILIQPRVNHFDLTRLQGPEEMAMHISVSTFRCKETIQSFLQFVFDSNLNLAAYLTTQIYLILEYTLSIENDDIQ